MAVNAVFDANHYSAAGVPLPKEPRRSNLVNNPGPLRGKITITTATLADVGDHGWIVPVRVNGLITRICQTCGDMDSNGSPTLNADLILRTFDDAGAAVDTVIYDSSALSLPYSAAKTAEWYQLPTPVRVPASSTGMGHIMFYVNAAAATAVQGVLILDVDME